MIISFIVAADEKNGMAIDGHLPWHLPKDFKMFKEKTSHHYILMGRKTMDSLGNALPNRPHIVITRKDSYSLADVIVKHSIEQGIELARENGEKELFIIGGGEIFEQAFPQANRIYLTRVHHVFRADTFFPEFDKNEWTLVSEEFFEADEKHLYPFTFQVWERNLKMS